MNFTNSRAKNLLDILLSVKKGNFFLINLFFQKYVFKLKNQIIFFCFHFLLNCRESRIPHPLRNQPEPTPKTLKKKKKIRNFSEKKYKKKNTVSGNFSIVIFIQLVKHVFVEVSPLFAVFLQDFLDFFLAQKSVAIGIHFVESFDHFFLHCRVEFGHFFANFRFQFLLEGEQIFWKKNQGN